MPNHPGRDWGVILAALALAGSLLVQTAVLSFRLGKLEQRVTGAETGVQMLLDIQLRRGSK